ncbi:hypothetical protein [Bacillus toyonensis]|uniref:hypothetical protein n=1 Tax=Bacillus toyonensis TaxID=155322 RepID=UPI000BFA6779|nr:hypothetical protein [Bacillus toyonensis]PGF05337.1 hypothetical protein COM61_02695 [Bacillus toyonensis]
MLELQVVSEKNTEDRSIKQIRVLHNDTLIFLCSTLPTIKLLLSDLGVEHPNESILSFTEDYVISNMKIKSDKDFIAVPYTEHEENTMQIDVRLVGSVVDEKVIKLYVGKQDDKVYLYYPKEVVEDCKGLGSLADKVTLEELSLI